jgi:hypothetical protein
MEAITLIAAYVIPLVLVVWLWLGPRSIWIKGLITALLPAFYFLHWQGLQDYKGWPAEQSLPEKFELIAADVVEPTAHNQQQGRIYLWVRPDLGGATGKIVEENTNPRAYRLPYSRKLHEMLFETRKRIQAGQQQIGLLRDDEGGGSGGATVGYGYRLEFIDKPKSQLPPKK